MQAALQRDAAAASQVAMLLGSCIAEVRGRAGLEDSLQLMTQLDTLLKGPPQPSPQHFQPAMRDENNANGHSGAGTSAVGRHVHNATTHVGGGGQQSPPRDSRSPSPSDRSASPGPHDAPAGGVPRGRSAIEQSNGRLREEYDGADGGVEGTAVACAGAVLRLARLPAHVTTGELIDIVRPFSAVAVEEVQVGEFLVEFEALGAAVRSFRVLPTRLDRLGYKRVAVTFATAHSNSTGAAPT